jgi:hypothetical protein
MAKNKTKLEKERLEIIGNMPCYACYQDGKEVNAEVHHIRNIGGHTGIGKRPSHFHTVPLCVSHHRNGKVSVHLGKKEFVARYGTEQDILKKVNREIEKCKEETKGIF